MSVRDENFIDVQDRTRIDGDTITFVTAVNDNANTFFFLEKIPRNRGHSTSCVKTRMTEM